MNTGPDASPRWRCGRALIAVAAVVGLGFQAPASAAAQSSVCFHPNERPRPDIAVIQQAPAPPASKGGLSAYYPATAFATQNLDSLWTAEPGTETYYFQWANRSTVPIRTAAGEAIVRKSNFQPGPIGPFGPRTAFTSIDKANACTLAQSAAVLGLDAAEIERIAAAGGVRIARPPRGERTGVANATDICVVQPRPMPRKATGIVLDYEVQDGRTPAQTLQFLTDFADLTHRAHRKAILMTNGLDAPTQVYTSVNGENASRLANLFDGLSLFIWSRNPEGDVQASFDKQFEIANQGGPVDPKRLFVVFELANTSANDARLIRDAMIKRGLGGVMFWRNGAKQGGDCASPVNRKIACLALGRCDSGPEAVAGPEPRRNP